MNILAKKWLLPALSVAFMQGAALAQTDQTPVTLQLKNEEAVNSKGLDFSPTFYEDGIVFISTNAGGLKKITDNRLKLQTMSIVRSRRNSEGLLSASEPFSKEISSKYHEGPVCFDRTAEKIYFSSNVHRKGVAKRAKDGEQKMKLYVSTKTGEAWSEPEPLPFNTDEYDDCHPSISIDGDKLFFSSDRPGGFGGMDLYVSFRLGETWSEPVNLGPKVNSVKNEAFPFLHADNTLYFASDGLDGQGGFDLFYTVPEGSEWTTPVNLGTPFNTKGDDFGLIVDLDKINGYFSSNGNGGSGGDDIFSFHTEGGNLDEYFEENSRIPERPLNVIVSVLDGASNDPIADATVRMLNLDNNNVIGRDSLGNLITIQSINGQDVMKVVPPDKGIQGATEPSGKFTSTVRPGNYVIIVAKEGYQTQQITQKITRSGTEFDVVLNKAVGKVHWNAVLFNDLTNAPLAGATLILTNEATGEKTTIVTDANGAVDYYLEKDANYAVEIYQGGRQVGSTRINTTNWTDGKQGNMTLNISASPIPAGTVIELPNIYYNYNDASLRPDAKKDLDLVMTILRQYPDMVIELASHTDARGTDHYNDDLSMRRAKNVVAYLTEQGVAAKRLKPQGYGERQIRNQCKDGVDCSEKDHARNRRTEIRVLSGADGVTVRAVEGTPAIGGRAKVNQMPGKVHVNENADMEYYVIAGSFLMENRASNQANRLRKAGFSSVEVVQFGQSPFYSVVAKKAQTLSEAQTVRRQIENREKINSFVKPVPRS